MDVITIFPAPIRHRIFVLWIFFVSVSWQVSAQSCSCPPVNTCGCNVGLTKLSVEFTGLVGLTVFVEDGGGTIYSGVALVTGSTFEVESSAGSGQPFVGDVVTIRTSLAIVATINTSCADGVKIGSTFGNFTVTAGESVGGTPICCKVMESTKPVISGCPSNITVSANTSSCGANVNWAEPTASDNCAVYSFTSNYSPGDFFPAGSTTTVTYTAEDNYGNTSTCSFTITVNDDTNPMINGCPSNMTASANSSCQALVSWTEPTASDNCNAVLSSDHSPGEIFPLGTTTVTYTATDDAGNTSTCSFDINVVDDTDPMISGCPSDMTVSANLSCEAVVSWTEPTASDNCNAILSSDHSPGETFPLGTTTVTYTATDDAGNTANCSFDIDVVDDTDPVISGCPSDIPVSANASCQAVVNWTEPLASDNCNAVLSSDHSLGEIFPLGTTTVTYTATDDAGNTSTCSFDINVVDDTDPVISGCPSDMAVSANASCQAVVSWTEPLASDNCNAVLSSDHSPGEIFPLGTTTVTYTATDDAGNTANCSFNVTVTDDVDPEINNCPSNITISSDASSCGAAVSWTLPTVSDNCSSTPILTSNFDPGDFFSVGTTTTVSYQAEDDTGNSSSCSFNVTVNDDSPPVIQNCPSDITISGNKICEAVAEWPEITATDNCAVASLTTTHKSGEAFPVGTTEVEYTATDANGNTSNCLFNVTVVNKEKPVLSGCPDDVTAKAGESGEAIVTWVPPTATDECGDVELIPSQEPGTEFPVGTTVVKYRAANDGNKATLCTFKVVVSYEDLAIDVADVITPDGDGINDKWIIINIEKFSDNQVAIVDRWGSTIYQASGYNNDTVAWGGENTSGSLAPSGTYFYYVEVKFRDEQIKKTGFIELIQ